MALVEDEERNPFIIEYTKGEEMFTVFKHFGAKPIPTKPSIQKAEFVVEEEDVAPDVVVPVPVAVEEPPELIDLDIDLPEIALIEVNDAQNILADDVHLPGLITEQMPDMLNRQELDLQLPNLIQTQIK